MQIFPKVADLQFLYSNVLKSGLKSSVLVRYVVCLLVVSLLGYAIFAALLDITINMTNESADFSRNPDIFSFKLGFFSPLMSFEVEIKSQ